MTHPGKKRETDWITMPLGLVRVALYRGFDCRKTCEHVPPKPNEGGQNHGAHCDEWKFELRQGDRAAVMQCYSWIYEGKIHPDWKARRRGIRSKLAESLDLSIYGARLVVHRKCDPDVADVGDCPVFGFCTSDFAGFRNSRDFFEPEHSAILEPLALHPVDEIDLLAVVDAMRPLWSKLAGYLMAKEAEPA